MASGFALRRNGSCLATETECGQTVDPYHACCPLGSFCPHAYNVDCCPTSANCTISLLPDPQCANKGWDLFDNGGYFCCLRGLAGYATPGNTNGCAEAGYRFNEGEQLLSTISTGKATATTISRLGKSTTSPSPSPSRSSSATESPETSASSSPAPAAPAVSNTGAIVGGSVGSVLAIVLLALLAWYFLIRRKRRQPVNDQSAEARFPEARFPEADHHNNIVYEKDSRGSVLEMPDRGPAEMPLNQSKYRVPELTGTPVANEI